MNTKKAILSLVGAIVCTGSIYSQELSEITDIRLYEHHSSAVNGGIDFGWGANGAQSGYDFVNNTYYNSFDPETFGAYSDGEEMNIDLVEHNGPFGDGDDFGFTSGVSTIWGGAIRGNSQTKWMLAPGGFDYESITDVSEIVAVYDEAMADTEVEFVENGDVYIARIRETDIYVAMRCYDVTNLDEPPSGYHDVYFNFDYKYGTSCGIDASVTETDDNLTATASGLSYQWVDCNNDNEPIDGETGQTFEPTESGSYAVEITDGECTVTSDCYEIVLLGITDENQVTNWQVYPNPAVDQLTIESAELTSSNEMMLVDMSGRTILIVPTRNSGQLVLDLQDVQNGSYILKNDIGTFSQLIIKQ